MKKFWLLALVVPLLFISAPRAEAVACGDTGTFAGLQALGSCTIGDKTFSNFTADGDLAASAVSFTVIEDSTNFGFRFQFSLVAFAGESKDIGLGYNVAVTDGSARITDVTVTQTSSVLGNAIASVGETVCVGAFLSSCEADGGTFETLLTFDTSTSDQITDRIVFDPVSRIGLLKDFVVAAASCPDDNGCSFSFASLSIVENTVSQTAAVPEPATLLLLGSGLVGVATWSRKKFRK